ncbi:uncharacterized protein [Cherax quadricarinatus]|uniref:uncharacterized protein n=1 Tax=Cherax quadricarinatus TaxID=27406 RepID=UPI00387ECE44
MAEWTFEQTLLSCLTGTELSGCLLCTSPSGCENQHYPTRWREASDELTLYVWSFCRDLCWIIMLMSSYSKSCKTHKISNDDIYGVSVNGASQIFVKFTTSTVYEDVQRYQDLRCQVNPTVAVCLRDVSRTYTWVKIRNVPFEADEHAIRKVFTKFGMIHQTYAGVWSHGPFAGKPDGSFSVKMSIKMAIPSFVLDVYRTQVYVYYPGQRKKCRLCDAYGHMAYQCGRRRSRQQGEQRVSSDAPTQAPESMVGEGVRPTPTTQQPSLDVPVTSPDSPCVTLPCMESSVTDDGVAVTSTDVVPSREVELDLPVSFPELYGAVEECPAPPSTPVACDNSIGSTPSTIATPDGPTVIITSVDIHAHMTVPARTVVDGNSRKRAAGNSSSDELTPGQ